MITISELVSEAFSFSRTNRSFSASSPDTRATSSDLSRNNDSISESRFLSSLFSNFRFNVSAVSYDIQFYQHLWPVKKKHSNNT